MNNEQKEDLIDTKAEEVSCQDAQEKKILEVDILRQSVEEQRRLAQNYYDQLLRLKADFENYRKRSEKEKKDYLELGKEKILVKQIYIDDILQQALKSAKTGNNMESIGIGLDMISKEFSKMLHEEGVEEISCKMFDLNICEALDIVESDQEDGRILEVYQKGYTLNGKLIRPAKVKVAKNNSAENKKEEIAQE